MMSALALVAAFLYNLGVVLEKRALRGLPPVTAAHPGRLLWTLAGSVGWLAGFGLIGAGLVLQGVVLAHLPFSIAQPLQASGVVVTVVLSRLLLAERRTGEAQNRRDPGPWRFNRRGSNGRRPGPA